MSDHSKENIQGEGDYESAKRYTDEKRAFVESGKVDEAAERAGEQPREEGNAAREAALERAKEHDPREKRNQ